jgi:transcriptional regulator with XRE-family HTH domain
MRCAAFNPVIRSKLGNAVRKRRRQLGLSQRTLAKLSGLAPSYILELEKGEWNATLRTLTGLCNVLDLRLSKLFATLEGVADESADISTGIVSSKPVENIQLSAPRACISREQLCRRLGAFVCQRRRKLGLSQEALAEHAGVRRFTIHLIETGKLNVTLNILARLSASLNLGLRELCAHVDGDFGELAEIKVALIKTTRIHASQNQMCHQLGDVIWKRRTELGFLQEALAKRAGLSATYISKIESGQLNVRLYTLARLCAALDMRLSDLHAIERAFGGTEDTSDMCRVALNSVSVESFDKQQKQIGNAVRKHRMLLGLTQVRLAKLCEFDPKSIIQVEAGRNVTLYNMTQVCATLGLRLSELWAAIEG